jgi:biopolymer transport protein ExbB/TolQ
MDIIIRAFKEGGVFIIPIMICAVFALAIAAERLYYIMFRANINGTAFFAQIQKLIMANNIDRAIKLCNAEPNAALPRVLKSGLTRANRGDVEIENAINESQLEVNPNLTKRTPYLAMLANVATLTGLLGTIQGLIQAFEAVDNANAAAKSEMLAAGIAVAMFTTMMGLMVAIPTLVLASIIQNKTTKILDEVDLYSVKTINLLGARRRGTLADEGAAKA